MNVRGFVNSSEVNVKHCLSLKRFIMPYNITNSGDRWRKIVIHDFDAFLGCNITKVFILHMYGTRL